MSDRVPMTPDGLRRLRDELARFQGPERIKNVRDIERAREHGDISENAEFEAAKERQAFIEGKIMELKGKLADADVIDPSRLSGSRIVFGATVTVEDAETGGEHTYQIVGEDVADVKTGRISVHSPIARALIGKEEGDTAIVTVPDGSRELDIIKVQYK